MTKKVYTVFWENNLSGELKQHGTFKSYEDATAAIKAWWEMHEYQPTKFKEKPNGHVTRIEYGHRDYVYKIVEHELVGKLLSTSYKQLKQGQVEDQRKKLNLSHDDGLLFDQLPEPRRDRIIVAMGDINAARNYTYDHKGKPITKFK